MKKVIPLFLAIIMLLSAFGSFVVSADGAVGTVYISDNGNDSNDGLTAETPVKTWPKAGTVLQSTGTTAWKIVIVDISTYAQSDGWYFMNISSESAARPATITGLTPNAVFNLTRGEVIAKKDIAFESLNFKGTRANVKGKAESASASGNVSYAVSVTTPVTAFISDNGDDKNDGWSASTPKKTFEAALGLLDNTVDQITLVVVDSYTYEKKATSDNTYYFLSRPSTGPKVVIHGATADAKFYNNRSGSALRSDVTFENIQYISKQVLYANGYTLEFADTVTGVPTDGDSTARAQFPVLFGGLNADSKGGNLILNGGTFNYVYASANGAYATTGTQTVTIGKNATIMHTLHVDQASIEKVVININGTVGASGGVGLRFSSSNSTAFNDDVIVNIYANASILGFVGVDKLSANLAETKTATFNFSHNKALYDAKGADVAANGANIIVTPFDNRPVMVGVQSNVQGAAPSLRFCATLDVLDYAGVAFRVVADYTDGATPMRATYDTADAELCTEVYENLTGTVNGSPVSYAASDYGAKYFFALAITGLPADLGDVTFKVTPYAVKAGGEILGETVTVQVTVSGGTITVH